MDPQKVVAGVAQLIPEGYVDIIRRVTPGATVWVAFYFLTGFPNVSSEWLGFAGLVVFFLVSYATGMLIDAIGDQLTNELFAWYAWKDFVRDTSDAHAREAEAISEKLGLKKTDLVPSQSWGKWRMPGLLRAKVMQTNAEAGVVLPKLAAEGLLLRNLSFGLSALITIMLVACIAKIPLGSQFYEQHTASVLIAMGVIAALGFFGALYRTKRTVTRTLEWFWLSQQETHGHSQTDQK